MKKRFILFTAIIIAVSVSLLLAGCNIFDFASDVEKSPTERAEDAIRDGNYAKAKDELADAVADSTDAMALYLSAKIALLENGIDLAKIAELVEKQEDIENGSNLAILELIDEMSDTEKTDWYHANMDVRAIISKIWEEKTNGLLEKDDIALDYTISNMMSGVLGLRDTNRDGDINNNDFQINLSFIEDLGSSSTDGFNFDGAMIKDESGIVVEDMKFEGLTIFLGEWQGTAKAAAETYHYTPNDINQLLAFVLSLLDDGAESLTMFLGDVDSSFDIEDIEENMTEIASIINYYWYHDGVDNDNDGRVDEEMINGKDDDNDGLIDEDSHYHPADPINSENEVITNFIHVYEKWQLRQY